jgi:alpha-mannosidase
MILHGQRHEHILRFATRLVRGTFVVTFLVCFFLNVGVSAQTPDKPDLSKEPTLYVVGYAHLDTEWRWEYPQVINEYLLNTMKDNFSLFENYPHYTFNFSGANRYRLMKEYYPADFAKLTQYVHSGRWFPAGSSMEEGDVNTPSAETIIRQILYGNNWFRKEFGKASAEYMLPDCFGFPASLPTILAHSGVKGFSTQKLVWGSSAPGGGWQSLENTPEGTPFNVGLWVGPDGESVLAGLNPGSYSGGIETDLSKPLPPRIPNPEIANIQKKFHEVQQKLRQARQSGKPVDQGDIQEYTGLRSEREALNAVERDQAHDQYQDDWAARVEKNGKVSGVFTDYHYYGTGDIGGSPDEESVKRLEAIVTKGAASLPPQGQFFFSEQAHPEWPPVKVGDGPVHVLSATADQMFLDITPSEVAGLPRYTGEMELTNHSAGSLTSQAYQKRWLRKEELLAEAAEESSIAAEWLGARPYPLQRLNDAWTLVMGGHFHDIAAGTATPKSYEFAWNDDVIAMNQFAGVLTNATEAVAADLNTETKGFPVVVFNPLSIAREDVVEANMNFSGGIPKAVRVTGPSGAEVPAQMSGGKVLFLAKVPSVGYAVYDVQPGTEAAASSLKVSKDSLENQYYRVKLNADGDVTSIFDRTTGKELLAGPARLAISYDNPKQWPAWNMDWNQEQAAPKAYVGGPAKIRVVEDGPVRVAVEVSRETAGSWFVQTIRLSAGDAGKRVEFGNVIDWNTRESNLKATFPLTASNRMATYNWDIGTIERPTAEPKKFEVPSHQWIDLTDMSGEYGATVLTDCKNGSDKPNDNTIRLTLIRTPGTAGGYSDQGTQDLGHHEFVYGIAGHARDWRSGQTDWQGQRLNDPLIAFATTRHAGAIGKEFSLLKIDNPRIRLLALKQAEQSDEAIMRLVELDGKPQAKVRLMFASPISAAREVNGQEQPVGAATVKDGALVTSFSAYQPRTFAIKLAPSAKVASVKSTPIELRYDIAVASNDGTPSGGGFDGKGGALPAEALPSEITFNAVQFRLPPAKTGVLNAIAAKGQTISLPAGHYNRGYILAASADGDQSAKFAVGSKEFDLDIQNWGGFIGQWDDRQWIAKDTPDAEHPDRKKHDDYSELSGIKPGYIKRADLAWYCSHHHDAAGKNVAYSYSYLFAYPFDVPPGAKSIKLPDNDKIRILAISIADENPAVKPAQPLYDVLPAAPSGPRDFALSTGVDNIFLPQGRRTSIPVAILPRNEFKDDVTLKVSGLPPGVRALLSPAGPLGARTITLEADGSASPTGSAVSITGTSGNLTHAVTFVLNVTAVKTGTVAADLSSAYNATGIYDDDSSFAAASSLDGGGFALSEQLLGATQVWDGVLFKLGPANAPDVVTSKTVNLPVGKFAALKMLAAGVEGSQESQDFTVTYSDATSSSFTQSLSDWFMPENLSGESTAVTMNYRLAGDGSKDDSRFHIYGYSFDLDSTRVVSSITLPDNRNVVVFAMTLTLQQGVTAPQNATSF